MSETGRRAGGKGAAQDHLQWRPAAESEGDAEERRVQGLSGYGQRKETLRRRYGILNILHYTQLQLQTVFMFAATLREN